MELVVVIAILGILAGLAIPRFMDATASARGARIVADMRTIDSAIMMYNAKTGNLPTSKDALTIDKTTGGVTSAIKVLAAWPTPPTGTAKVTAFNGSVSVTSEPLKVTAFNGSEVTLTAPNPNEYTLDAVNGRALYNGNTVDQILTNK